MEYAFKVICFILLSASVGKSVVITPGISDAVIIAALSGLFYLVSKIHSTSEIELLKKDNEKFKKDLDSLNTKLSSITLRNQVASKNLMGR